MTIKNSVPGEGEIYNNYTTGTGGEIVRVHGSYLKDCNPRTQTPFSHLTIEEGVNLRTEDAAGQGVTIFEIHGTMPIINDLTDYLTNVYGGSNVTHGAANGVRVDIKGNIFAKKYPVKVNGNIRYPDLSIYNTSAVTTFLNTNFPGYTILEADTAYSPFVRIYPSAQIKADNTSSSSVAVYSAGYGRIVIEGSCEGASALYMKSGDVKLQNAILKCEWTGLANIVPGRQGGGVNALGNGIVLGTEYPKYAGHMKLAVNGDTKVSTKATDGCALVDVVPGSGTTSVNEIKINGGSFSGTYAMVITNTSISRVLVYGANLTGEESNVVVVGTESDITPILANNVHTVVIPNNDETTTVIVSQGAAPSNTLAEWTDVAALAAGSDAKWTGTTAGVIASGKVQLGELQAISGTQANKQQLTIKSNAALEVDRLILSENARIIVEKGAKLIVNGTQGINAPSSENIQLVSSEGVQSIFLLNPEVTSNRHPNATYKFTSKAYNKGNNEYVWQRFGVPAYMKCVKRGDLEYDHTAYPTSVMKLDYAHNKWASMDADDEFIPFRCYELTTSATTPGAVYTFTCPLMGNSDAELVIEAEWSYYANSYTAPIDIASLIDKFSEENPNISATIYLYRAIDNWWYEINNANLDEEGIPTEIAPMQAFIFQKRSEGANPVVSYKENIWDPAVPSSSPSLAPAKKRASSLHKAVIEITAEDGTTDAIRLIEGANLSADFDNSYDATKYMNAESFNLFADLNEDKMAILATDNLEGTTLSMTTKNQTSFTMSFKNVNEMNYIVRDELTGTETAISKDATYMFSVPANSDVKGRFKIVQAKVPTNIDNVADDVKVKGIYTITGQFVGNDYHALPSGVYVVDGKKIVK